MTNGRALAYWVTTGFLCFGLTLGGVGDILRLRPIAEGMAHLGYPLYVCVIIGVWKLLGAAVLLAPRLPLIKEWAYAGVFFNMSGAVISHLVMGDTIGQTAPSATFAALAVASWVLRPASRRVAWPTAEGVSGPRGVTLPA